MAFPVQTCVEVYGSAEGYRDSVENLTETDFASDMVFSEGVGPLMTSVTGNIRDGYSAFLQIGMAV